MKKVLSNKRVNKLMSLLLTAAIVVTTLFSNVMEAGAVDISENVVSGNTIAEVNSAPVAATSYSVFTVSVDKDTLNVGDSTTIRVLNAPGDGIEYSSSDKKTASISGTTVTGQSASNKKVTITATAWEWKGSRKVTVGTATCTVTVNPKVVPITGVVLAPTSINLKNGGTSTLTATVQPTNTTLDNKVTWTSSDETVATVNAAGGVTAVSTGTATITATSVGDSTKLATSTVTVANPVESITLKSSTSIVKGSTETIVAIVNPTYADNQAITWSSNKPEVATVDGGVITAVGKGTATITATTANGVKETCSVTVTVPTTGVSLNEIAITIDRNGSQTLTATVLPEDANDQNVKWKSNNNSVAKVNDSGKVSGQSVGTATITATASNGATATCVVTVVKQVTNVKLNKNELALLKGNSGTLSVTVTPNDATNKAVMWSSDNDDVATVDKNGKVTAVGGGTANITVTSVTNPDKSATCKVTVTVPTTSISVNEITATMNKGAAKTFTYQVLPEDATNKAVEWSSSNKTIATVDENGTVTAIKKGTAIITVKSKANASVQQTITITVIPDVIEAEFYILKENVNFPGLPGGWGNLEKISGNTSVGNDVNKFYPVGTGTFSYAFDPDATYAEAYSTASYDSAKVEGAILNAPDLNALSAYNYDSAGYHYSISSVDWYVIKKLTPWHIDGKATYTRTAINYSVDYQVASVSDNIFRTVETDTRTVEANKTLKTPSEMGLSQEGYYFDGWYSDEACTVSITSIPSTVTENKTVYGKWIAKTAISLNAIAGTVTYDGTNQNYTSSEFAGVPANLMITGLISNASGTDAGVYTTTTDASLAVVMQGDVDVSDRYTVSVQEATFTIEKAVITVSANNASRAFGEENPTFEINLTGVVPNDSATHTIVDFTATTVATKSSKVGDYAIVPSLRADLLAPSYNNYTIVPVNGVLTVRKAVTNKLTVSNITVVYNGTEQSVFKATSAIEGSKIQYQLTDKNGNGTGKWLDKAPSFKNAGTYKVLVKATKKNYETDETFETLTITKAPITVTANDITVLYKQVPVTTVDVKGIVKADNQLSKSDFTATITGDNRNPGTYRNVIIPSLKKNASNNYSNYEITFVKGDLKILKAPGFFNEINRKDVKFTFDNVAHSAYKASAEKGSTIYYSTDLGLRKSWSEKIPKFTEVGTYTIFIKATHVGYEDSYSAEFVVINKAKQTVTFADKTVTFEEGTAQSLDAATTNAIGSGKTKIQYSVNGKKWSNTLPTYTNVGTYKIYVKVTNSNYEEVTKSATLTILQSEENGISANNVEGTYNGKAYGFSAQALVNGSTVYYNTTVVNGEVDEEAWTTDSPTFTNVGTYSVKVRVENKNYVTKEGTYNVTIEQAEVTITVDSKSKIVGEADPKFTGKISVANAADFDTDQFNTEFGLVTYGRIAEQLTWNSVGNSITITAKYVANTNFKVTVVDARLVINSRPSTPVTPSTPTTPVTPVTPVVVIPTTPVTPVQVTTTPVAPVVRTTTRTQAAQVVEAPEEEVVIEDEPVAEVSEPVIDDVKEEADKVLTAIEDEDTAKAVLESDCWIHWMILILTALYSAYAIVRAYVRNKRIKELEDNAEEVNA